MCRTIWIDDTFWATAFVGITEKFVKALAGAYTVSFQAFSIGTTRIGYTRPNYFGWIVTYFGAEGEWISCVAHITITHGSVIHYTTLGIGATNTRTRIATMLIYTGLIRQTFWICYTFGSTIWWRTYKVLKAGARWISTSRQTFGIRTTWWWTTRIFLFGGIQLRYNWKC